MWTTLPPENSSYRVFTRPLDTQELCYFYESKMSGTADVVQHLVIRTKCPPLFDEGNITRAWIATKQLFPLLGASLEEETDSVTIRVSEDRLCKVESNEIKFGRFNCGEDGQLFEKGLNNGLRQLSDSRLARLFVFSREDDQDCYHILFNHSHIIVDGIADMSISRTFLDILSLPPHPSMPELTDRLYLALGSQNLKPKANISPARRLWRKAIATVIFRIRTAKLNGGISLPRKIDRYSGLTPSKPNRIHAACTPSMSLRIMEACRRNQLTFGHVQPVLSQIASSRVLHRKYLRGEIPGEEWERKIREPFNVYGPVNLRPFLDKSWFADGGVAGVALGIGFFNYTLPFMPVVPRNSTLDKGTPYFSSLLTRERFFSRCQSIKMQSKRFMHHPLFLELIDAQASKTVDERRLERRLWQKHLNRKLGVDELSLLPSDGVVFHNGGSSIGDIELMRPTDYPLPDSHPFSSGRAHFGSPHLRRNNAYEPLLHVLSSSTQVKSRPAELYLGALTKNKEMVFWVSWDTNVYEESVVEEWLAEFKAAAEWYLGEDLRQRSML